jgi:DNA polymerase III delta prime subunit
MNNNWKRLLTTYLMPSIMGAVTLDSWLITKKQSYVDHTEVLRKKFDADKAELLKKMYDTTIENSNLKVGYEASIGRVIEGIKNINQETTKINELVNKINDESLSPIIKELAKKDLDRSINNLKLAQSKVTDIVTETSNQISSSNIIENNMFSFLGDFFNNYKEFLTTLSVEQHACLFNLFGYFIIFFAINSVIMIYYGDILIKYFNLEKKYPKLSHLIQLRRKILSYHMLINFIIIYSIIIIFMGVNVYMFFN